jgi:hypothetical protein
VADETAAQAGGTGGGGGGGSFELRNYDSPKALADGLTANWTDAVAALADGSVERHVRERLNDPKAADDIAEIAKDKSVSEDTRLFRVILRLDPREDAEFMGYEPNEGGLSELAAEVDGPFPTLSATGALRIMYTDRVLSLYADAAKTSRFHELDERWHEEFETWGRLVGRSQDAGGPDVFAGSAWRTRAKILRGLLDTKDEEPLRVRAREAAKKPTVVEWTSDADPIDRAGIGTLLACADLEDAADIYDASRRAEGKAAASRRRRGILGGVATVALLVGVVVGIIAFTSTSATVGIDFGPSNTPSATVATSIDPKTAEVVGTEILQEATPLLESPDDGAAVVQQLAKGDRLYRISKDTHGFYFVKSAKDDNVVGWVAKSTVTEICPLQCG